MRDQCVRDFGDACPRLHMPAVEARDAPMAVLYAEVARQRLERLRPACGGRGECGRGRRFARRFHFRAGRPSAAWSPLNDAPAREGIRAVGRAVEEMAEGDTLQRHRPHPLLHVGAERVLRGARPSDASEEGRDAVCARWSARGTRHPAACVGRIPGDGTAHRRTRRVEEART